MAEKKPFPGFLSVRVASSLTKKGKETIRDVVPVLMALLGSIFIGGY